MENLSHTLLGAAIAETRLGKRTPLAMATALVGTNLPDLDVLAYVGGSDAALLHRRGWTHGPLAMVLLPLALAGLVLAWDRWVRRRRRPDAEPARAGPILLVAALTVWSHPALDWLNTYGVRLLMPFDGRWLYGDALYIADPWLWLVLGGAVVLARRSRGVGLALWAVLGAVCAAAVLALLPADLRGFQVAWLAGLAAVVLLRARPRHLPEGERIAAWSLAAVLLYSGAMVASSAAARTAVERQLGAGGDPLAMVAGVGPLREVMAGPELVTPFTKQIVAAGDTGYRTGRFRWLKEPRLVLDERVLPRGAHPEVVIEAALAAPCVQGMVTWMRYPFFEVDQTQDGWEVWLLDARYTKDRNAPGIGAAVVRLGPDLEPLP